MHTRPPFELPRAGPRLRISQLVDVPNVLVSAMVPTDIFV